MSIPCTGREKGISTLILGLQIFNKNRRPIKGSPMKLTLKKHCEAFGETLADIFTCLIITMSQHTSVIFRYFANYYHLYGLNCSHV